MLYLLIALALIGFLLFSRVKIFCEYKKHPGEKLCLSVCFYLGAIRVLKLKPRPHKKDKKPKKPKEENSDERLVDRIKRYAKTVKVFKKVYARTRFQIQSTLCVDNIDFHLKFGLGNAAITGIATGAIWSLLYGATALVSQVGTLKKHFFEVVPVYTEKGLVLQGSARLSVRVINGLILALTLFRTYKKVKKQEQNK